VIYLAEGTDDFDPFIGGFRPLERVSGRHHNAAMDLSPAADSGARRDEPYHRLADMIYRLRYAYFALIAVLFLICFNGQWKIGRDSALYRGLARNIVNGRGYTFGDFAPQAVYPGYPLLLAGIEKVFGSGALAPLVVMYVLAGLVLVYTYRLIAMARRGVRGGILLGTSSGTGPLKRARRGGN
jgi:hypothetical protein